MGAETADDKYSGAVEATLGRSGRLRAFLLLSGGMTLVLIAATPLPLAAAIGLLTAATCATLESLHRLHRPRELRIEHSGAISVDGCAGTVRSGSFVAPWLAVIRWRPAGARLDRTVVVLPDMLPPAAFRELRVILVWGQTL